MEAKVFSKTPNELKTIEVDVEKKIFNVNGTPFGNECTSFNISCDASDGFVIRMDIDTTVHLASYRMNGEKNTDYAYEKHSQ